ncbi:hypothetical protein [Bartonella sp. HY761]|uniref:hypothetical protein n=1 Tax=Bartonella sp. HY761 TaxID=2979330 RepID=UPI002205BD8C|nr:hypothetical protein [Bartonella sp. HY761]UXN05912.1 hypothetical protein N6A79_11525 [Bartonella sp. HY761]
MTVISKKILDADENALEQSNQNALAQVLSSSTTGSQLHIVGDFGNGSSFTGTNLDDTVTITGNLLGAANPDQSNYANERFAINLLEGNDTLVVGGKTLIDFQKELRILGGDGDKSINFGGNIENNEGYFSLDLLVDGNHDILIDGDLSTNGGISHGKSEIILNSEYRDIGNSYKAGINISGNIISKNWGYNSISNYSKIANLSVQGSVYAEGGENKFTVMGEIASIDIQGLLKAYPAADDNTSYRVNNIGMYARDTSLSLGGLYADRGTNRIELASGMYDNDISQHNIIINGDITTYNYGHNGLSAYSKTVLEVNGDVNSFIGDGTGFNFISRNHINSSKFDDSLTFLGNFFTESGENTVGMHGGNDDLYIEGNLHAENNGSQNTFSLGDGNDIMTLIGNVTAANGGRNRIWADAGDDIIHLNGHINAGALEINGGPGNDTLILTASTLSRFEANYKDWLVDLSSSGLLASNIETIRLDVRNVQPNKIGWLTDLVNQANANGANITLEDKNGNVITEPQLGLAADSGSANAFSIMADQHSADSASARDFANDNYNAAFDQHAQTALIV